MGRTNFDSVNVPKGLKPLLKSAAQAVHWSEAKVADAALRYVLDLAAAPGAASVDCDLVKFLAAAKWRPDKYPAHRAQISLAADRPANSPAAQTAVDKLDADTLRPLRKSRRP